MGASTVATALDFTYLLIPFALAAVVVCATITTRRLREAESGVLVRWALLGAALVLVVFGSMQMSQPVSAGPPADGDSSQCGSSAVDAAGKPPDLVADANGDSCLGLGRNQLRNGYILLAAGCVLAALVARRTRVPDSE